MDHFPNMGRRGNLPRALSFFLVYLFTWSVSAEDLTIPRSIPETAGAQEVLANLEQLVPGRRFTVTGSSVGDGVFAVVNGQLKFATSLSEEDRINKFDYETNPTIDVTADAVNNNNNNDVISYTIKLRLANINDEHPQFTTVPVPFLATLSTDTPPSTTIFTLSAEDVDGNGEMSFSIERMVASDGSNADRFRMRTITDEQKGQIITIGRDPFPLGVEYTLTVNVKDEQIETDKQFTRADVKLLVGERSPQFDYKSYTGSIYETSSTGNLVDGGEGALVIRAKSFQSRQLTYKIYDSNDQISTMFSYRRSTGNVINSESLDYETLQSVRLTIAAVETGSSPKTSTAQITINIKDENDNKPQFASMGGNVRIAESADIGSSVLEVTATDKDSGRNGEIEFSTNDDFFDIETTSKIQSGRTIYIGTLKLKKKLDYESEGGSTKIVTVEARDKGNPVRKQVKQVNIRVTNVNDEPPEFTSSNETMSLPETVNTNFLITFIQATDKDGDGVEFSFLGGSQTYKIFSLAEKTGALTVRSPVPDSVDQYTLTIIAKDDGACCEGNAKLTSTMELTVVVVDQNQNKPEFTNCTKYGTTASVNEHARTGTEVVVVRADDPDRGINGEVHYYIMEPDPTNFDAPFIINRETGNITVKSDIDREGPGAFDFIQVTIRGENPGKDKKEGWCTFRVTINDINDHDPYFEKDQYSVKISSTKEVGSVILRVPARDNDIGDNSRITYSLVESADDTFAIYPLTGIIYLNKSVEQDTVHDLKVIAEDQGTPPRSSTGTVVITVEQSNVRPPTWVTTGLSDPNNPRFSVKESVQPNTPEAVIATFTCNSNVFENDRVEFQLIQEGGSRASKFKYEAINDRQMNLSVNGALDLLEKKEYSLSLRCLNFGGSNSFAELNPVVTLTDANNQVPYFKGMQPSDGRYAGTVAENSPPGSSIIEISGYDDDETPLFRQLTFTLEGDDRDSFEIRPLPDGNRAAIVTGNIELDREDKNLYFVTVVATDGAPADPPYRDDPTAHHSGSVVVVVTVTDVNDMEPRFEKPLYSTSVYEDMYLESSVMKVTATDEDLIDQQNGLIFSFTSGNYDNVFGIKSFQEADGMETKLVGEIFIAKKLDYENDRYPKVYNLTVVGADSEYLHTATTNVVISVLDANDNEPVFDKTIYEVTDVREENDTTSVSDPLYLVKVHAEDQDKARNETRIRYAIKSDDFGVFRMNPVTGWVYLIGKLNRDEPDGQERFTIIVEAEDEAVNPNKAYTEVQVMPQDINDNAPFFENKDSLQATVPENEPPDTYVQASIIARDYDDGPNAQITYTIVSSSTPDPINKPEFFNYVQTQGLKTKVKLDREEYPDGLKVTIMARDNGENRLSATATVTITITDKNDEIPFFPAEDQPYIFSVPESQPTGEGLGFIEAKDKDIGNNALLTYSLQTEETFFRMETMDNRGIIVLKKTIDYETDPHQFNITVKVEDTLPHHTATASVQINILDTNDNAPKFEREEIPIDIYENLGPGTHINVTFKATDKDSGINAEFEYSIYSPSDLRREFFVHPETGEMWLRKSLDREQSPTLNIIILAIDKGDPAMTGSATLVVTVLDRNDNFPRFAEPYLPVVMENGGTQDRLVVTIFAVDDDSPEFGPPFGFKLPLQCNVPACKYFRLIPQPAGDGGKGTAEIRTSTNFDREERKEYYLPIVMWDMRDKNSPLSQTGTNTLTIVIGDVNDNKHSPGHQDILVHNYEGLFGDMEIGRVYAKDPDDWDLPDKTFEFVSPEIMRSYFEVNRDDGMITMKKGVPSNFGEKPYKFKVNVRDNRLGGVALCTVSVTVKELTKEAVYNSGGVQLGGIRDFEFIEPKSTNPKGNPESKYSKFRSLMAEKLDYPDSDHVDIVSIMPDDSDPTERSLFVRYAAHGSPYLQRGQVDSVVVLNKKQFAKDVGLDIQEVPISVCEDEMYEGGCYSKLEVIPEPMLVNANGTSFVGVKTMMVPVAGCEADKFPDPVECTGNYCFNGGTCTKDLWGVLSCKCLPGFNGPRCQELKHSFKKDSTAFYDTLTQCADGLTSLDFITEEENGLILYNGPISPLGDKDPKDFILLELKGGYPQLRINLGSGEETLAINGRGKDNSIKMSKLNDGKWHHIDIHRMERTVELVVDRCLSAEETNGEVTDDTMCRVMKDTPGFNTQLDVSTLLQLGAPFKSGGFDYYPLNFPSSGFVGCLRNLRNNGKVYNLNFKAMPNVDTGENKCPREDAICGLGQPIPECGVKGHCEAQFSPPRVVSCRCQSGWYGRKCDKATPIHDLKTESFFTWRMPSSLITDSLKTMSAHIMFRSRQRDGILLQFSSVSSGGGSDRMTLELYNGRVSLKYSLGYGEEALDLGRADASDGQLHSVRVERHGSTITLQLDGGEGRNYADNYRMEPPARRVTFDLSPNAWCGGVEGSNSIVSGDLVSTCVQDIRVNDKWFPMETSQNSDVSAGAQLTNTKNTDAGCTRDDCGARPCPPEFECVPLWEDHMCRCRPGTIPDQNNDQVCLDACSEDPCFNGATCQVSNGTVICVCPPGWTGDFCNIIGGTEERSTEDDLSGGAIAGIIIGILLIILLIVLIIFLLRYCRHEPEKDPFLGEPTDDDFMRENIMFYDEEGAGEEDHTAFDLTLLQRPPVNEAPFKPEAAPRRHREAPRRNAPSSDRPDIGSFIDGRLKDARDEDDEAPSDSVHDFNSEGGSSDAGSLSSLNTSSSDRSQDYDYLNDWGPKFAKLADMYGAGGAED